MKRRDFLAAGAVLPGALRSVAAGLPVSWPTSLHRVRDDDRFEELARLVERRMAEIGIPGVAFGVIKNGQVQMRGFGVTSVEDPRPVTPDTVFELASLSKTFAATAAMTLVERGKLDLDAPVRRYVPGFRLQDESASAALTLRHLLTHTGGWEAGLGDIENAKGALGRWAATLGDAYQLAAPGRVWSYSNPCFALAGHLIEIGAGMEVHDAFDALVFKPLGLDRASVRAEEVMTWPLALGHRPGRDGRAQVVRPYSMGISVPSGGVNASVASIMKYLAFHLGEHDGAEKDALSRASREAMRKPQLRKDPTGEDMGIGFHLRALNGVQTASHGGTAGAGHRNHLQIVPERRLGFAILTNHTEGWRLLQDVERATLKAYDDLALTPNQPINGYRGHTETLDHVTPLARQPPVAEYLGRYRRTARGQPVEVRAGKNGGLQVGDEDAAAEVLFYGPDLAFVKGGRNSGISYNFVRENGQVRWMRSAGQVGRKEG